MTQSTEIAKIEHNPTPVLCGTIESSCKCIETPHSTDAPHVCECGGSWIGGDGSGPFQIIRFPGIFGQPVDLLASLMLGDGS